ncbi:DUF6318 family protein [Nocardioides sp.]|uniref:DUF6318 family protein n=1 Tax=Nocardioides sp. TaxID=35761 RepID=UPI002CBBB0AB|nr:DUF6318 family protein [Nocardioides sp.]HSX67267.1 DUF6318 family protein [Nocardioides sp.]
MALQRLTTLALVGALALGVSACGDDSPSPAPSTSSAAASPTPSATGPAAPVLPELAARNDAVGAKAFLRYWVSSVSYAMKTGDTTGLLRASTKECKSCAKIASEIDSIYAGGGHLEGGGWRIVAIEPDPRLKPPLYRLAVRLVQASQRVVDGSGAVTSRRAQEEALFFAGVRWEAGFRFFGLERIDD